MPSAPLPPNTNPSFAPDFPGAIVYPAHPTNYYSPDGHSGIPNTPRAWVLHTPEEPADDNETTPAYFAGANRQASTHYYVDNDGDVYQLVPESCAAIANGLQGKPLPSWALAGTSLNWQTLSVEIEGFAGSIEQTLTPAQFGAVVALVKHRAQAWGIPLDREHVIGHYEVSVERSDPGAGFPWSALLAALQAEEEVEEMFNIWSYGVLTVELPPDGQVLVELAELGIPAEALGHDVELEVYCTAGGFLTAYHGVDLPGNNRAGQIRDVSRVRVRPSASGQFFLNSGNGATGAMILPLGWYS